MTGYFHDPGATARAPDVDGWLHTGDLGSMDRDGYVRIQGRLTDMIIRGGENIYPREIEDVLFEHSPVTGASVLGVPDEEWGEVVAAYVQPRPEHAVTGEELERFCRQHLASFKVPRIWRVAAEAGCPTIAVYHYFEGKQGLHDALYAEGHSRLRTAQRAHQFTDDPAADVRNTCLVYRLAAGMNSRAFRLALPLGARAFGARHR